MNRSRASGAATARELGMSDVNLFKHAKAGNCSRNADGSFNIDLVKRELAERVSPLRGGDRSPRPKVKAEPQAAPVFQQEQDSARVSGSLLKARTMRESYEAQCAKLKYQEQTRQLIDRAGIEMAIETAFRQMRDSLMGIPDRLPIDAAHRAMFRTALRDTLTDSAKMLPTMMAGEPLQ